MSNGQLIEACGTLRNTVSIYPESEEAWILLAETQQKLGDWDSAYSTWQSLSELTDKADFREFAFAAQLRANDERVVVRLIEAEQLANSGDHSKALRLLLDAVSLKPSARVFDRIRSRYYQVLGSWFGEELLKASQLHSWKKISVANFTGAAEAEGYYIRDRICGEIASMGMGIPTVISLLDSEINSLRNGSFHTAREETKDRVAQSGSDAIVFGTIPGQLSGYVYDVREAKTYPLLMAQPLSSIPGFPSNIEAWTRIPNKNVTGQGLRVEVWTEKTAYNIDEEVMFHVRSNKDCYITLVDLQTSGGLYVLLPNDVQKDNFVEANQIKVVMDADAPFSINATGPGGVEGVKAIATSKPLSIEQLLGGGVFVTARSPEHQKEICDYIQTELGKLNDEDWDIAEWTFKINESIRR